MKKVFTTRILLVAVLVLLGNVSMTVVQAAELKGVFGFGLDFGGETLLSGSYTSGSTWAVRANQGFALNGGVVMVTGAFETQATVGYKSGGPQAKNGSVTLDVMPVELMEFYRTNNLRMGLGVVYHSNPKLVVDIPGSSLNGTYKFDNAIGTIIQVGWAAEKSPFSFDLRYTMAKFKESGIANAKEINGNSTGLYMSIFF